MQKLLKERLTQLGLSQREAAARSNGLITNATLSRIMTGVSPGPWTVKTLRGIALACDLPMSEVEKAADIPSRGAEFRLPREATQLSGAERAVVLQLVRVLLEKQGIHGRRKGS